MFWEILLIQLHSTANSIPLSSFQKKHYFVPKNTFVLFFKTNFWTFWEVLLIESHSTRKLLPLVVFKKLKFFFDESISFFPNKSQFSTVLRNLTTSVAFYTKFATFGDFWEFRFFSKNPSVLFKKNQIWTFWELSKFQSYFSASLIPMAIVFEKKKILPQKNPNIFSKNTNFFNVLRVLAVSDAL